MTSRPKLEQIASIVARLDAAKQAYIAIAATGTVPDVQAASDKVKQLQQALSDCITEGAQPCPGCGARPHGMLQHNHLRGDEWEIGCLTCKARKYIELDRSTREPRVRVGGLPRHAVETWNEGPLAWRRVG